MKKLFLVVTILALASSAQAGPITIGAPSTGGNSFPFGESSGIGTRYQQVYDASSFPGLFTIDGVTFFNTNASASFEEADYTLSLSTTSKSVNGLDTSIFDNNVGADDTLLFSGHLAGATGLSITLGGSGVFAYNPALGNLLVDIQLSNAVGGGSTFFDARNGDAGGLFSRAHDFGTMFVNWGLVTRFEEASSTTVPDPGSSLLLLGLGLAGLRAWKNRLG
jgi:hypothetical protein